MVKLKKVSSSSSKPVTVSSRDKEGTKRPENLKKWDKSKVPPTFPKFEDDDLVQVDDESFSAISADVSAAKHSIKHVMESLIEMKKDRIDDKDKFHQVKRYVKGTYHLEILCPILFYLLL